MRKSEDQMSDAEAEDARLLHQEAEIEEDEELVSHTMAGRHRQVAFSHTDLSNAKFPHDGPYPYKTELGCYYVALFVITVSALVAINSGPLFATYGPSTSPPWFPTPFGGAASQWTASYEKARSLVDQMTIAEKVNLTTGVGWMQGLCVGNTGAVPRLNFPSLCLQDGPLGIRFTENITAFPAGITVAATWDKDLFFRRGRALGAEARAKGVNVLLGPAMGPLGRSPLGGRNWEGFGSDPYLQGIAAAETIQGIQGQGVIATAKHWVANEQEHFRIGPEWRSRESLSVVIDDRTLHELYAWPFQDSIRAGVGSVMCSYNQVNNSYACQNSKLLNGILKDEYGFQGFVQSDWLAQHTGVESALSGLDMTMPGDKLKFQDGRSFFGPEVTRAVLNGSVPMERVNDMAMRIVAAWYQLGQDNDKVLAEGPNFSSWTNDEVGSAHPGSDDKRIVKVNKFVEANLKGVESHSTLARKIAADSIVLLKNKDNFLPLDKSGHSAQASDRSKGTIKVGIFGSAAFNHPKGPNVCQDRACIGPALGSGYGSGAVEFPYLVSPFEALAEAFQGQDVELSSFRTNNPARYDSKKVSSQDLCLVFLTSTSGEGYLAAKDSEGTVKADRNHLYAQNGGEKLVSHVQSSCGGDVVVVIHSVGPILVETFVNHSKVKAILWGNLPGQESGHALTDVLFGDVNPSGKLPYTIGRIHEDYGSSANILRSLGRASPLPIQTYDEGTLIDYRHFDRYQISPRFEFGFGLSYTTFKLDDMTMETKAPKSLFPAPRPPPPPMTLPKVEREDASKSLFPEGFHRFKNHIYSYMTTTQGIEYVEPEPVEPSDLSPAGGAQGGNPSLFEVHAIVHATISNTGSRAGASVVQAYVNWPLNYRDPDTGAKVDFPIRTLRGFSKVYIDAGQSVQASFELTRRDLSYWSTFRQNWVMPDVPIKIELGFSSRDLRANLMY
jgi:beta-glucosidase